MRNSVLFIFLFMSNLVFAETTVVCEQRVPTIEAAQAIELVKSANISSKPIFIDKAKLICTNNQLEWLIGTRIKAYESGHLYVTVSMDGKVTIKSVVKDG